MLQGRAVVVHVNQHNSIQFSGIKLEGPGAGMNRARLLERVHFPCATSLKAPLVLLKRNSSLTILAPLRLIDWQILLKPDSIAECRGKGLSGKLIWF